MPPVHVTVWNEFEHEKKNEKVRAIYPDGIHEAIAGYLRKQGGLEVGTATLDQPEHGLTEELLQKTDVLIWWGHRAHGKVDDAIVDRVHKHVLVRGMGLIVLHSGHFAKIFKKLMGTTCNLAWREAKDKERLWVVNPYHPITAGLPPCIEIQEEEMYGEYFDIPEPDALLLVSWFTGGEVFRSGAVWHRGKGKVFYFRPGHETYPTYHNPEVLKVIENGVRWAAFAGNDLENKVWNAKVPPEGA
jgi:trehalose utilization protein